MSKKTTLAAGDVTAADRLVIELVQPGDLPATILIRWPAAPSVTDPRKFGAVANAMVTILAEARGALARHQAGEI